MDDDLDKLLSDIESVTDFTHKNGKVLSEKKKFARRSDSIVKKISVDIDENRTFLEDIKSHANQEAIGPFKNGVIKALTLHRGQAQKFRDFTIDYDAPESIQEVLKKYKYTFLRSVDNIEKLHDEYVDIFSFDALYKKAKKDLPLFFREINENEIENNTDFLLLKDLFIHLREFNSKIRKEWDELSKSIGVIKLVSDGITYYQDLNLLADEAIRFCKDTNKFIDWMAEILCLQDEDKNILEKEILNKIHYHKYFPYKYEKLFKLSAYSIDEEEPDGNVFDDEDNVIEISSTSVGDDEYVPETVDEKEEAAEESMATKQHAEDQVSLPVEPIRFNLRGTSSWNNKEPYILKIDYSKLEKEHRDLEESFYFISEQESNDAIEGTVKRMMLRYLRDTTRTIESSYEEFIYQTIISILDRTVEFFNIDEEKKSIFIYHCGPLTLYRQINFYFQESKTGTCFKYLQGNRVKRHIPLEFIKSIIMNWHEENINTLKLNFDKIQIFTDFRRMISDIYYAEFDKYTKKLNEIIAKLHLNDSAGFDRNEYFKSKWNQWFGETNIAVYNRFLDKTIFKS